MLCEENIITLFVPLGSAQQVLIFRLPLFSRSFQPFPVLVNMIVSNVRMACMVSDKPETKKHQDLQEKIGFQEEISISKRMSILFVIYM